MDPVSSSSWDFLVARCRREVPLLLVREGLFECEISMTRAPAPGLSTLFTALGQEPLDRITVALVTLPH